MTPRTLSILALLTSLACKHGEASSGVAVGADGPVVAVTVDGKGFTPSSVQVKKGAPLSLRFTRTTDDTCAKQVVFPELKITKELPLHVTVPIDVPTDAARTLTFQCGMGMFKSSVVVL